MLDPFWPACFNALIRNCVHVWPCCFSTQCFQTDPTVLSKQFVTEFAPICACVCVCVCVLYKAWPVRQTKSKKVPRRAWRSENVLFPGRPWVVFVMTSRFVCVKQIAAQSRQRERLQNQQKPDLTVDIVTLFKIHTPTRGRKRMNSNQPDAIKPTLKLIFLWWGECRCGVVGCEE